MSKQMKAVLHAVGSLEKHLPENQNPFRHELESLLNSQNMENGSQTPDYVLAQYLTDCLCAFDTATKSRDKHLNIEHFRDGMKI